jgi:hypothetical protein
MIFCVSYGGTDKNESITIDAMSHMCQERSEKYIYANIYVYIRSEKYRYANIYIYICVSHAIQAKEHVERGQLAAMKRLANHVSRLLKERAHYVNPLKTGHGCTVSPPMPTTYVDYYDFFLYSREELNDVGYNDVGTHHHHLLRRRTLHKYDVALS